MAAVRVHFSTLLLTGAMLVFGAQRARAAERGTTVPLMLQHASHPLARGATTTAAYLPPGLTGSAHAQIVVLLHGWSCCAATMVTSARGRCGGVVRDGWGLGARVDESGTDTLFLVPQLALGARDGSAGQFAQAGFFAAWLSEALDALGAQLPGERARWASAPIALVAHSAGYETALAILRDPHAAARVRRVVMLDALYAGAAQLVSWLAADSTRRVVSVHTRGVATTRENARLVALAQRTLGPAAIGTRVLVIPTRAGHAALLSRSFAPLLSDFAANSFAAMAQGARAP